MSSLLIGLDNLQWSKIFQRSGHTFESGSIEAWTLRASEGRLIFDFIEFGERGVWCNAPGRKESRSDSILLARWVGGLIVVSTGLERDTDAWSPGLSRFPETDHYPAYPVGIYFVQLLPNEPVGARLPISTTQSSRPRRPSSPFTILTDSDLQYLSTGGPDHKFLAWALQVTGLLTQAVLSNY
ncbi:hypothetical protein CROQUDRAFT_108926 [Cronartium quercuum f. sp. fusiforme G11]|uniref:Uncharacterized protein n=1 Tax=Cronartium quercuum f. sp. fusiforme G11 TaxID=708437 RepID=A0A9P6NGN7_9BASI|nr:hypothetical protein CROQUDRAFT_108926 [Cronartium quercuum f. sp. fusiforme G11]